jgi:hypothetical protein
VRETYESALALGREALIRLGNADEEADGVIATMRRRDAERLALEMSQGMEAGRRLLLSLQPSRRLGEDRAVEDRPGPA